MISSIFAQQTHANRVLCLKTPILTLYQKTHNSLIHTSTHYNTLQHATTYYNTLQHTATHCNTPQYTATDRNIL